MKELVLENSDGSLPYILQKNSQEFNFENPQEDAEGLKNELVKAMVHYKGMGISACQIGVDLQVFAMRFNEEAIICFNPNITQYSEETTYINEGCLSFPGLFFPVHRSQFINATYANYEGQMMSAHFLDISAKVFQHEYDHMKGKLFLEYTNNFNLRKARKKQALRGKK